MRPVLSHCGAGLQVQKLGQGWGELGALAKPQSGAGLEGTRGSSGQTWCRYEDIFVGLVALPRSTVSGAFSVTAGRWGLDTWPLIAMALSQL